jgi:hypothetical protein
VPLPPPPVPEDGSLSAYWAKVWYNCNQFGRYCLGNALDDPAYRRGVLAVGGLTLIFSSNRWVNRWDDQSLAPPAPLTLILPDSPALHSIYVGLQHPPPVALLNAGAGVSAAVAMLVAGPFLADIAPCKVRRRCRLLHGADRLAVWVGNLVWVEQPAGRWMKKWYLTGRALYH